MTSNDIPASSGIYRITCTVTSKFYIGSAVNLRNRWMDHRKELRRDNHRNSKLQRAWNKHGEHTFTFEILELVLIPDLLTAREQHWFDTLKPFGKRGFNIALIAGSSLGMKHTQESRQKISATKVGKQPWLGKKHTPETCEKLRLANLGKTRTPEFREKMRVHMTGNQRLLGHKHSEETRQKMSKSQSGRTHTPETKEKIGRAHLGYKHSPEAIKKMQASHAVVSDETRAKLSASLKGRITSRMKPFIVIAPDGTEYIVQNMAEFCKQHNLDSSALIKVAKGRYNHYKKWTARYLE